MTGFVNWLRQTVDAAVLSAAERAELGTIFRDVLRYELLFFDMAYRGEAWPG
jgi:thiaminase